MEAHPDLAVVVLALAELRQREPRPSVRTNPDAELGGIGEAEAVVAVALLLRLRVAGLSLEEALERRVEVAQDLLEAVVRNLGEERVGLLQLRELCGLLVVADVASAPREGAALLERHVPQQAAGTADPAEAGRLRHVGVDAAPLAAADGNLLTHALDASRRILECPYGCAVPPLSLPVNGMGLRGGVLDHCRPSVILQCRQTTQPYGHESHD